MVYDIDLHEFRKVIEDAFSDVGITKQKDMAKYLGYSEAVFSTIMNGKYKITDSVLWKIQTKLGINILDKYNKYKEENLKKSESNSDMMILPMSAWEVIQAQAKSLEIKDRQMDELIQVIKVQQKDTKKTAIKDTASCADVG